MKTCVFTIADNQNLPYAKMMAKSLNHFHKDLQVRCFTEKDIMSSGITPEKFFYLATPFCASHLFKDYDCVIKIDADTLITGNLDHILNDETYDVGTVYNWNRVDPRIYGEIGLFTIQPKEYYNCGFVVMRNRDFVNEWLELCNGKHFDRMPMREQGFLNILAHYGRFKVKCFDNSTMWHGLISKGEWNRCTIKDGQMVLPKGKDHYPQEEKIIKAIHWGGGNTHPKLNYKVYFQEDCIEYIDTILK